MENTLKVITNILKLLYKVADRVFMLITNVIVEILIPVLVMLVLLICLINVVLFLIDKNSLELFIGSLVVLAIIPWYSSYLQKKLRGE